eukprot:361262-Chlamydomonas_euryale.AAC.1
MPARSSCVRFVLRAAIWKKRPKAESLTVAFRRSLRSVHASVKPFTLVVASAAIATGCMVRDCSGCDGYEPAVGSEQNNHRVAAPPPFQRVERRSRCGGPRAKKAPTFFYDHVSFA